jgi:SAM-dependent methyltransferase
MNHADIEFTVDHYERQFELYGYSPKALGWKNGRHNLRYQILLSQWKFDNHTLLDFGCGFGDMYGFCVRNEYQVAYEGVDISPQLIAAGKKVYPDAHLWSGDVFEDNAKRYDFIVSSGVHNLKISDNWSFIRSTFDFFDAHATQGFALNFLSNKVDYTLPHAYHADPAQILDLAYQYSNRVILRNDYMPFEYTVFVDKRSAFDQEFAVYPEYLEFVK